MTPLTQAILNDYAQPKRDRKFDDSGWMLPCLTEAHSFEVTPILEIALDLARQFPKHGSKERLGFLPALKTFLEFRRYPESSFREGLLLEQQGDRFTVRKAYKSGQEFWSVTNKPIPTHLSPYGIPRRLHWAEKLVDLSKYDSPEFVLALLACINTPRVINRRQHMPHAGLQRKLAAARGMVGKFPLLAWTEIKLEVAPPRDASGDGERRAYLTGAKALHFCRTHLRVRMGQLELVTAHWRGDPSLGIKQSRYSVVPPKGGGAPQLGA